MLLLFCFAQLAYVPSPAAAQQSSSGSTYAAYQEFEQGFMVWREDTGEILTFISSQNILYRFPEATYDKLPANPVLDAPPSGLVKPIRGFGRVWGNFPQVRFQLGWGKVSEFGYSASSTVALGYPNWEQITLPNGAIVRFFPDNTWHSPPVDPPVTPQPAIRFTTGAIQEFVGGKMLYMADTGTIWVLTNQGDAYSFLTQDYGYLPENPVWAAAPPGYIKPFLGFGKVWGNFLSVRNELSWALSPENSYGMQLSHNVNQSWISIQLPNGQWVDIITNRSWHYR